MKLSWSYGLKRTVCSCFAWKGKADGLSHLNMKIKTAGEFFNQSGKEIKEREDGKK